MTTKCLIIDDNPFIVDLLSDQLELNHPELQVVGHAQSGREGLEKIYTLRPDLIFLDVEMLDMSGFDMLDLVDRISFQTIFITSFSHYAIKAIRFNALDYLVKPIEAAELRQAIKRYFKNENAKTNRDHVEQALQNLKTDKVENQILPLNTQEGVLRLALKNIIRIESERNYSFIYLVNNVKKLSSKTLGYFEEILSEKGFYRCHRSFLINRIHVKDFQKKGAFILSDGTTVLVSRRKKSEANVWFKQGDNDGLI